MDEPSFCADLLGKFRQEGYDVVLDLALDLTDAGDAFLRIGLLADLAHRRCRFLGDGAEFGQCLGGQCLDLEPNAKTVRGLPDRSHLGAGVAGDHGRAGGL